MRKPGLRRVAGLAALSALLVASFVVTCARPPSRASGERAVLRGAVVNGARTGTQSPTDHTAQYRYDNGFQWDVHGSPGADVYPAFHSSDGEISLSVRDAGEVGLGTGRIAEVTVAVDGQRAGVVRFMHVVSVNTAATRPTDSIGQLPPARLQPGGCFGWPCSVNWLVTSSAGIHLHLDVDQGCYSSLDTNTRVAPSEPLIMIASGLDANNSAPCDFAEMRAVNAYSGSSTR